MAKVSLRTYHQEIETMVENGQLDEAIAHCRHILNAYPKSLETYRLLGKAYLETKRYDQAINVFQRVVMAVPGDFVSHVGMSIINDEQNKLDDAIWHMERAFESQPSNAAIQAELQRLYGRRDGVEPPKIRLTRGALAQMYVQGELYPQAISEISSVLEEDPDRQDMQVLLARAYFHSGQKSEAAEICSRLLLHYPYNLDANRVLVELLPESERAEGKHIYRHRVNDLEPYTAFATGSVFRTSEVPDGAVSLEKLDWDGAPIELDSGLGASPSIDLEDLEIPASDDTEQPDWMKVDHLGDEPSPVATTDEPAPGSESDSQIPEFLREAGWTEDSGTIEESASSLDSSAEPEPEIEPADLPDWIKEMAPEGVDAGESAPVPAAPDLASDRDSETDWLQDLGGEEPEMSVEDAGAGDEEDFPDWLGQAEGDDAPSVKEQPAEQPAASELDLSEIGSSSSEQDEAVAWLEGLAAKHGAKEEELVTDPSTRTEAEPEWVKQAKQLDESDHPSPDEFPEKEPEQQAAPSELRDLGVSTGEKDDAIPWSDDLETGSAEPELPHTDLEVSQETAPDEEPVSVEPETPVPSPEAPLEKETVGVSTEEQEDAIAWLENLAEKHGAKPEELVTDSASRRETAPEWVQQASEVEASSPAEQASVGDQAEPVPVDAIETGEPQITEQPGEIDETILGELEESLADEPVQPTPSEETGMKLQDFGDGDVDDSAAPELGLDDWSVESGVEQEPVEPVPGVGVPDWLSEMEETVSEPDSETEKRDLDLPDWLSDVDESETPVDVEKKEADTESLQAGAEELPGWLAGLEDSSEPAGAAPSEELPQWVGTEEPLEPEEPEELDELDEPLTDKPVPTAPDEWQPVADQEPDQPEPQPQPEASEPQPEPVTRSGTGLLDGGTISPATSPALNQARTELSRGNIPAALEEYGKLIKKGKYLDETIFDLREALYRYPVEVSIWQSLGDAYMRENRLQDALDAYTKAEELLR